MTDHSPIHHVGLIVADVDEAAHRLTELVGLRWTPVIEHDGLEVRDATGADLVFPNRFRFSLERPRIELIEEQPGTPWVRNGHSELHHLAFLVPDLGEESTRLQSAGCAVELCGRTGATAPTLFSYHRDDDLAVRIEILDAAQSGSTDFLTSARDTSE